MYDSFQKRVKLSLDFFLLGKQIRYILTCIFLTEMSFLIHGLLEGTIVVYCLQSRPQRISGYNHAWKDEIPILSSSDSGPSDHLRWRDTSTILWSVAEGDILDGFAA
jgi:hypothetical protein